MPIGRFSEGIERLPEGASSDRVGTFADGAARNPGAPATARVGSFADGQRGARRVARIRRRPTRISQGAISR